MLNLCDRRLGTTARATPLDDDVHVVANLVSTNPSKRKLGYKPALYIGGILAVDIIFQFPVSVSTVQFSTTCSKPTKANLWLSRNIPAETTTTRSFHMTLISTIPLSPPTPTVILSNSSPQQLFNQDLSRDTPILRIPECYEARSCQCLRIVVETMGADRWLGEVKVLGDVGMISGNYLKRNNVTKKDIMELVEEVKNEIKKEKTEKERQNLSSRNQASSKETTTEIKTSSKHSNDSDVPEEYLDAITREIMVCPVILPSGNVVDASTIDRHTEAERKWGRESSDPFTGVAFKGQHAPVHHTSLKDMIDKWREGRGGAGRGRAGRCVGVGSSSSSTSQQILNGQAKRVFPNEDRASSTRAKRLKKLQPNHEQSDDLTVTRIVNNSVQNSHNSPYETAISITTTTSNTSKSDVSERSGSTVVPNNELSTIERTLALLASHEERLEMF